MTNNQKNHIARTILSQYAETKDSDLKKLKKLDSQVKRPANVFAYNFGAIASLVMGGGMSLTMTDIGSTVGISNPSTVGIIIGTAGLAAAVATYPIYKKVLSSRRKKYFPQITALCNEILNRQS